MHEEEGVALVSVIFRTIKYTWKESMMKLDSIESNLLSPQVVI